MNRENGSFRREIRRCGMITIKGNNTLAVSLRQQQIEEYKVNRVVSYWEAHCQEQEVPLTNKERLLKQRLDIVNYRGLDDKDKWDLLGTYLVPKENHKRLLWRIWKQLLNIKEAVKKERILQKDAKKIRKYIIDNVDVEWKDFERMLRKAIRRKYIYDYGEGVARMPFKEIEALLRERQE